MDKIILKFLAQLEKNNNREWFNDNKSMYQEAKAAYELFLAGLIPAIARFDPSVKFVNPSDCLFRIFRDVRFSHDKSPYKTNFGAWITKNGRKSPGPGYYLHIQRGESFLAGGIHMPDPDMLKKIRQEVYYNLPGLKKILNGKEFKKYFSGIDEWDKQKLPPRDFPKDFEGIDLLKNRSYTVSHPVTDKTIESAEFAAYAASVFKAVLPYNQFLEQAIEP